MNTRVDLNRVVMLFIIVAMILLTAVMIYDKAQKVEASVSYGNDYLSTTTDATWLTLAPQLLLSKTGSLGSVVIQTIGTGSLTLYDATTTNNSLRTTSVATSTITLANWQITTSLGTYTFDTSFKNGLIAVWVGTNNATTTITYR